LLAGEDADHCILPQGRYAHANGYLRRGPADAGFAAPRRASNLPRCARKLARR